MPVTEGIAAVTAGRSHGFLDRERIVAGPGFNRWLVPPAALAIHLCIGMAYGFSVFWLPLSRAIGIEQSSTCPNLTLLQALTTTSCDWRVSDLVWIYTLFFVLLGASAALFGGWLERAGPRKAGVVSALCWCGGMAISAVGVYTHQLWLMWLGSGVIGGIGLGLGYISPVSTLIKWFPDRRGMATGMAIMGFGGGAMIGSPLADLLMNAYRTPASVGVWQTFLTLAAIYFVFMMAGALGYRVPPTGWQPQGWTPTASKAAVADGHVHLRDAHKTPQFWLLWAVLCLNVSASIGIIGVAAPMLQEIFGGQLIGHPDIGFLQFDDVQKREAATIAAGFVGLISLFNIGGRFFWASLSDKLGRKATYVVFFILGAVLYIAAPPLAAAHALALFVLAFCIIASMYGGGFATIPAYLADIFGTQFVGAIHGRLLTAWSTAGIIGPLIVAYMRDAEIAAGVPRPHIYDRITMVLAALLAAGFVANLLIRPLAARWFMKEAERGAPRATSQPPPGAARGASGTGRGGLDAIALLAWLAVGIPIAWGAWITLSKALVLLG
jgi:MFS family permease